MNLQVHEKQEGKGFQLLPGHIQTHDYDYYQTNWQAYELDFVFVLGEVYPTIPAAGIACKSPSTSGPD